jgi:predicted anti-sigma-YlaC factor YlaD
MPSDREKLEDAGLERLANEMQNGPDERRYHVAYAELRRRMAEWQKEARDTQVKASDAAVETARYTRESANWMRWSVIAIAMTSGLQALFAFLTWYRAYP